MEWQPRLIRQVLILLLALLSSVVHGYYAIPLETSVLLEWKAQLRDPLGHLRDWVQSPLSPCDWTGVTCSSRTFTVLSIDLSSMALSGQVSPLVAQLQLLKRLDISLNNFSGELPADICLFRNLQFFSLRDNFLTDPFPACLSQLGSLRVLDLSRNLFTQLPSDIGLYRSLSYLNAEECALVGNIPQGLGEAVTLMSLNLAANHLTGSIPPQIGQLKRLEMIDLESNMLEGRIPSQLGMLSSLKYLNVAGNKLTGSIPRFLGDLFYLEQAYISHNSLSGSIPPEVGNLSNLLAFDIGDNSLSGSIPQDIASIKNIRLLDLSMNNLVGEIPQAFTSLSNLQVLVLSSNQLIGEVPRQLGTLASLSILDLSLNFLVGPIPPSLCTFGNLSGLNLSFNFLSGDIPASLAECGSLRSFSLASNSLSGSLPEGIGAIPILKHLDLSYAGLKGTLDAANFGHAGDLEELYLQGNLFTGSLPANLVLIGNLKKLDLSDNMISGEILPEFGNCSGLIEIIFAKNLLTGSIPREISNLKHLLRLDLSRNALNGTIPVQFGNFESLEYLDLSNNELSGFIGPQLGNITTLTYLNFSHNRLYGAVPVNGAFQSVINISLERNPELCGGPARARLPSCDKIFGKKITIPAGILLGLIFTTFVLVVWSKLNSIRAYLTLNREPAAAVYCDGREDQELRVLGKNREVIRAPSCPPGEDPSLLRDNSEHVRAPSSSSDSDDSSFPSLTGWMPANWPWKLTSFVPDLQFNESEILHSCNQGYISRDWTGLTYTGVSKTGQELIVKRVLQVGMGPTMTFLLRQLETLRHPNIVKLLGYCLGNDNSLVAILYDKLPGGDLETALREGTLNRHPYEWSSLLEIALGTAKGLCYLHEHQSTSSLHSEITARNIFLDSGMRAHIAVTVDVSALDLQQTSKQISPAEHLSTSCTDGTDAYNFGVLLLQLLTGRQEVDQYKTHIITWFNETMSVEKDVYHILDPTLADQKPEALNQMWAVIKLAARCTAERADSRPSIEKVLWSLLKVQKALNSKEPVRLAAISDHCN